jgi:hypothetical protein
MERRLPRHSGRAAGESRNPSCRRPDGPRIVTAAPLVRGDALGAHVVPPSFPAFDPIQRALHEPCLFPTERAHAKGARARLSSFRRNEPMERCPLRHSGRAAGESRNPWCRRPDGPRIGAALPLVRGDEVGRTSCLSLFRHSTPCKEGLHAPSCSSRRNEPMKRGRISLGRAACFMAASSGIAGSPNKMFLICSLCRHIFRPVGDEGKGRPAPRAGEPGAGQPGPTRMAPGGT